MMENKENPWGLPPFKTAMDYTCGNCSSKLFTFGLDKVENVLVVLCANCGVGIAIRSVGGFQYMPIKKTRDMDLGTN